jgi:Mor family transcriptional regulator
VAADGIEGYPSREDRIVAEFGDGYDVEGIAFRHGLSVAQVYAVVEREVGPADQGPPSHYAPPVPFVSPGYAPQGVPDGDAIVAEYSEGQDVEWIARRHGINVEQVYEVLQRLAGDDLRPPAGPTSSW